MTIKLSRPQAASPHIALKAGFPSSLQEATGSVGPDNQEYDCNSSVHIGCFCVFFFSKGPGQDVVMYACNPNAREAEAGGMPKVQSQSFYSEEVKPGGTHAPEPPAQTRP